MLVKNHIKSDLDKAKMIIFALLSYKERLKYPNDDRKSY